MENNRKGIIEVENNKTKWNKMANEYMKDKNKLKKLLNRAKHKTFHKKGFFKEITDEVILLFSLVSDYIRGNYQHIETKTVIKILIGILYFVTPFDAIADFIPGIGLIDDIGLLTYLIATFNLELNKYETWKNNTADKVIEVKTKDSN